MNWFECLNEVIRYLVVVIFAKSRLEFKKKNVKSYFCDHLGKVSRKALVNY